MPVPPGDTARPGHCSSGVCALCPRAVGQGATLGGTRGESRTHKHTVLSGAAHQMAYPSVQPVPPRERHGLCRGHPRVFAWVAVPVFGAGAGYFSARQSVAAPRYLVAAPALTGRGCGVASGATKLVPAILSGLAQCRKQCPSLIGKPWGFFTIRLGRPLWLPLRLVLRTKRCALP